MIGLVGKKLGMSRVFTKDGVAIPVTLIKIEENRITQVKDLEKDGYKAIQITTGFKKANSINKPQAGHFAKAGVEAGRNLWEFRNDTDQEFIVGQKITLEIFLVSRK